jgi:3-oxoacyl-[acyl-carrier-protein] synthase II
LVDVLGGLDVAIATAKKRIGVGANEDVNIILYPKKVDNLTALLKAIGLNKEDGDEDAEARAMLRSSLIAKVTGTIPASEQIYRALPGGTRSQVKHALQLTELGMTERALMMLPMTVPMLMANGPAAAIGMELHARAGVRTAVSACASGTEAIANAFNRIRNGEADIIVAGGAEAAIHPLPIAAFAAMHALSKRNDDPAGASRPYDTARDGFVMGEGAGTLILESEEHAKARGAKIYAEVVGAAVTSDAHHITAPDPEGTAAARAMLGALEQSGSSIADVAHINAHATSTPVGDIAEYQALKRVFGEKLSGIPVSATKASTGHLLGGAGAIEAIFTVLALHEKTAPPTINLENQDPEIKLDVVLSPRKLEGSHILAITNSFGFGGHNAVVAFRSDE